VASWWKQALAILAIRVRGGGLWVVARRKPIASKCVYRGLTVFFDHSATRNKSPGAPSFAFFAKGGIRKSFCRHLLIPPFAKSAKDGAPGDLLRLDKTGFLETLLATTTETNG
jgi:hypothetical protein